MFWKKFKPLGGYYIVKIEEYAMSHGSLILESLDNVGRILEVPDEWQDVNGNIRKPIVKKGDLVYFREQDRYESIDEEDDNIVLMSEDCFKGVIRE